MVLSDLPILSPFLLRKARAVLRSPNARATLRTSMKYLKSGIIVNCYFSVHGDLSLACVRRVIAMPLRSTNINGGTEGCQMQSIPPRKLRPSNQINHFPGCSVSGSAACLNNVSGKFSAAAVQLAFQGYLNEQFSNLGFPMINILPCFD